MSLAQKNSRPAVRLACSLIVTLMALSSLGCDETKPSAGPGSTPEWPRSSETSASADSKRGATVPIEAASVRLDYSTARASASASESRLLRLPMSHSVGPRGFGKVLTAGLVPRKILAGHPKAHICDASGTPIQPLKEGLPYFVFDEASEQFLVGQVQDADLAQGWVKADDCFPWFNRRLCYPKRTGELSMTLTSSSGTEEVFAGLLPAFDPAAQMPWPILATVDEDKSLIVLADLRPLGGPQAVPIHVHNAEEFEFYVLFSQREIDEALENLTRLAGILPKMPVADIPRVFGGFLTQNQVDFVDLSELQSTLEVFPGKAPDFLLKRELGERLKHVEHALGRQIERLLKVADSTDHFNSSHYTYVVPLDHLL